MVPSKLTTGLLLFVTSTNALMGLAVNFERFSEANCNETLPVGQMDDLHNNLCKNWPGEPKFASFRYTPHETNKKYSKFTWMYDLPDCNVAIYSEAHCHGERYIMGPFPDTHGQCGSNWGWKGKSVGVACDKNHPYGSVRMTTGSAKGKGYDYQSQVDAVGIEHSPTELDCCKNPGKCTASFFGTTYDKKSCYPHAKYNNKTAGGRDRLRAAEHDMQWRRKMQVELKESAVKSKRRRTEAERVVKMFSVKPKLDGNDVKALEDAKRYLDYGDD